MSEAFIEVGEHGPYHVVGSIPLVRVSKVISDRNEPVDWRVDAELEADDEYWLCRCGHSDNKPFCTGAHSDVGFDGTETAPTNDYAERSEVLGGTRVTLHDDRGICAHAAFCSNRVTNVWKAASQIDDDEDLRTQVVEMVSRCPSGALTYDVDGERVEPDLGTQVRVQRDGSLLVTGGVEIRRSDGQPFEVRNRVALCRCGHSKTKPLCDGSHFDVGFTDG